MKESQETEGLYSGAITSLVHESTRTEQQERERVNIEERCINKVAPAGEVCGSNQNNKGKKMIVLLSLRLPLSNSTELPKGQMQKSGLTVAAVVRCCVCVCV